MAGLDGSRAELIRIGSNAIFRLAEIPVIVRVMRSVEQFADAEREVRVAQWLERERIPAVRVTNHRQPIITAERTVTIWESVNHGVEYGTTSELGSTLRSLHALPPTGCPNLPKLSPFDRANTRIARAASIGPDDREFLSVYGHNLASAYQRLEYALPVGPIHGDANVGNLLKDRNGSAVLSDLDGFSFGAREWDLIQTAMYFERYGWHTKQEYFAFCNAYGFDVMDWPGYKALADVKEFLMVTWLSQNATPGSEAADELARRVRTLRTGDGHRDWQPF